MNHKILNKIMNYKILNQKMMNHFIMNQKNIESEKY